MGRFLTADPIGYGDGLNVYAYVANDPVNLFDPSGLGAEQNRANNSSFFEVGPVIPPNNDAIFIVLTDDSRSIDGPLALLSLSGFGSFYQGLRTAVTGTKFIPKKPPNPYGSRGGPAHTEKIQSRIDELKEQGHTHLGGGKLKEEVIQIFGGCKTCRRPDITTRAPDGTIYRENVGRTTKSGVPVARERRALDDIEAATGTRPGYTPYDR